MKAEKFFVDGAKRSYEVEAFLRKELEKLRIMQLKSLDKKCDLPE